MTRHQLPHPSFSVSLSATVKVCVLFNRGHVLPRSSPVTQRLPSKQQMATCLPHYHRCPCAADFLAGFPTATLAVLQTSHISVQVTLLFQGVAEGGFPSDCRGQNQPLGPMATVHRQSALPEPTAFPEGCEA